MAEQLTIEAVERMYEGVSSLTNEELYQKLVEAGVVAKDSLSRKEPIGKSGQLISPVKRTIRWLQQDLKQRGILSRSGRGVWAKAVSDTESDQSLFVAPSDLQVLGFSTELGMAVWGDSRQLFSEIDTPIQLCLTSLPYPLAKPRRYGNPKSVREYIDFALSIIEPVVKNLADGGSVVLNLSNDIFERGSPARSTYLERLTIAIEDELNLQLMDRIVWMNRCKQPGPTRWACSKEHPYHLKVAYEPVLWFTNNPHAIKANNRRILRPNSEVMQKLYAQGGEKREAIYGDGAYRLSHSSYANETEGTLQSNVLDIPSTCKDTRMVHRLAKTLGLSAHSAMFPTKLAETFIRWLTEENELVVDPCAGSGKVGLAAQRLNRMWICAERVAEYILLQRALFSANQFELH